MPLKIGAHTSTSGGLYKAILEGAEIGANTIQIFTSNQRQWKPRQLTSEIIEKWSQTRSESPIKEVMSHASYLINLGSPKDDVREKSKEAFAKEVERCLQLDIQFLNFHPGSHLDSTEELCIQRIVEGILSVKDQLVDERLYLLLETTAGQGTCLGYRFEHLKMIIDGVGKQVPIGVCMDTCHSFSAGYHLRSSKELNETLDEFDRVIGLNYLKALHLNDSLKPFADRKDRHAPLGEGEIGWDLFKSLVTNERTSNLPMYLETPGGPERWTQEIEQLKKYAGME